MRFINGFLMALLAFTVLAAPFAIRLMNNESLMFGDEAFYHARIAGQIAKGEIPASDTLVFNHRPYFFGPYHIVLAYFSKAVGMDLASIILPVAFGLVSFILFFLILGKLGVTGISRNIVSVLLVTSPAFVSAFTQSNSHSMAIAIYLAGFYLLTLKRAQVFGLAALSTTMLFGFMNSFLLLALLFGHYAEDKKRKMVLLMFSALAVLGSMLYYIFILSPPVGVFSSVVSDLGGTGFGIFTFILLATGLVFSWKKRLDFFLPYFLFLILLAAFFAGSQYAVFYMSFIVAIFAGQGLIKVVNLHWQLPVVKSLTILIIVCGLTFSAVSYFSRLGSFGPDQETIQALSWLEKQPQGLVFSHYSNGFWIEYFAGKPVLLDGFLVSEQRNRFIDSRDIFQSRSIKSTRRLLDRYNVEYILIDQSMKKGKVWSKDDEGLLFLFRSNETFTRLYNNSHVEVWKYLPEKAEVRG